MFFGAKFMAKVGNVIYDVTNDINSFNNSYSYRDFEVEIKGDEEKLIYSIGHGDPIIKNNVLYYLLHIPYSLLTKFKNIPVDVAMIEQFKCVQAKERLENVSKDFLVLTPLPYLQKKSKYKKN